MLAPQEDRMPRQRQFLPSLQVLLFVVPLLHCGSGHSADELYVLVSTNIQVPYWKAAGQDFRRLLQLKSRYEFVGPDDYDPKQRRKRSTSADKEAHGILISAGDAKSLRKH